jgi:hypothetical protein
MRNTQAIYKAVTKNITQIKMYFKRIFTVISVKIFISLHMKQYYNMLLQNFKYFSNALFTYVICY